MKSNGKKIIVIAIIVLVVVALFVYKFIATRIYYNDTSVNGNTVGNLYGEGLYCECDGLVYFANPSDDDALYSMTPDENEVTKICDDRVYYINADSHYVYYCRNHNNDESQMAFLHVNIDSLCRINHNGKKLTILDDAASSYLALNGNTLYYARYDEDNAVTTMNSVGIDGKDKETIFDVAVDPRCTVDDGIYYSGVENDHYVHLYNINTKASTQICSQWTWMPTIVGNQLYFMDLNNNNRITCVGLYDGSQKAVSQYGTSDYNVAGNYIFYQSIKGNPDGIYRVNLTSGTETLLMEGQFNSINTTSKYLYFKDYYTGITYHCGLNSDVPSLFTPAVELENTEEN